jgi:hypothetical protein
MKQIYRDQARTIDKRYGLDYATLIIFPEKYDYLVRFLTIIQIFIDAGSVSVFFFSIVSR